MKSRIVVLRLHRWIGLSAGVVVSLLSLTGAILLYTIPADSAAAERVGTARAADDPVLPISSLVAAAITEIPDAEIRSIEIRRVDTRRAAVSFRNDASVSVDPWDGTIIGSGVARRSKSLWLAKAHENLLLGEPGSVIVGVSTVAFVGSILLGLWLWWPGKRRLRHAFLVESKFGWRRLNYDLHNVLGFYSSILLLLLGGTGVLMAYPALQTLGAKVANAIVGDEAPLATAAGTTLGVGAALPADSNANRPLLDRVWDTGREMFPDAPWQRLVFSGGGTGPYRLVIGAGDVGQASRYHTVRINVEGEVFQVVLYGDEALATRLSRLVGRLHTGDFGSVYRAAAFIACVIGTLLPATGMLIWNPRWRRRRAGLAPDDDDPGGR